MIFSYYLIAGIKLYFSNLYLITAKKRLNREMRRNPQSVTSLGRAYNRFLCALKHCERRKVAFKRVRTQYSRCPILPVKREIGRYTVSRKAKQILSETDITAAVERHKNGDWGFISPDDWQKCNICLQGGFGYSYSRHKTAYGRYFCIITDYNAPRSKIVTEEELLNAANQPEASGRKPEESTGSAAA